MNMTCMGERRRANDAAEADELVIVQAMSLARGGASRGCGPSCSSRNTTVHDSLSYGPPLIGGQTLGDVHFPTPDVFEIPAVTVGMMEESALEA